eukprot:CAMPEP_0173397668 /NCGR_PEP_ID=MMETSP1356-20130122/39149_1 /TAXON_ID=77927 ORGANISM="Hemiselmis virescens, Strain PCC157" /NCGR_SAMPLE_ID=MMETSP1356 /ASSEMBLY_ACC=CAM_ASM_000847 /LENGTH=149 /DNA_ID=CAMNT_0014356979 /DNA_START=33 /DNA_END=479 /DNA_ORIENTATION=+
MHVTGHRGLLTKAESFAARSTALWIWFQPCKGLIQIWLWAKASSIWAASSYCTSRLFRRMLSAALSTASETRPHSWPSPFRHAPVSAKPAKRPRGDGRSPLQDGTGPAWGLRAPAAPPHTAANTAVASSRPAHGPPLRLTLARVTRSPW